MAIAFTILATAVRSLTPVYFVEEFDDDASKAGWCLYKVGCRGPQTYNSCGNLRWWNGLSYPIQSGHGLYWLL